MTLGRLLLRNLWYHWRGNSAVFLGVVVGTAVLTGALLVGDSLRGSLRDVTLRRLAWVDHALLSGRFVREELAAELVAERTSPALLLQGTAGTVRPAGGTSGSGESVHRVGRVTILGVDERFWDTDQVPVGADFWRAEQPAGTEAPAEAVLSSSLARELGVGLNDPVVLSLQKVSAVPRETLLGRRNADEVVGQLKVTVRGVLGEDGLAPFSLSPGLAAPRNAFLPLRLLQARLGLKGRVNAILVGGGTAALQEDLQHHLTLDDWNLVLQHPQSRARALFERLDPANRASKLPRPRWRGRVSQAIAQLADPAGQLTLDQVSSFYREHHPYLSLESRQVLLEPAIVVAALKAAAKAGLQVAPTLVYLANSISDGKNDIPYSVVAALDPALPPPLGPFLPPGVDRLQDDELILADWKESPLQARPGEKVTLTYFNPEEHGQLRERTATFRVRGLLPIQGVASDPDLTPEFPGITDQLTFRDWDPPFPYDNKRVKPRDERYWEQYRTTPKAYVTLSAGQRLWGSRFGQLTSIRLAPAEGAADLAQAAKGFRSHLLAELRPAQGGLVFDPVRERSLKASTEGTDFGVLFLAFSIFLIVAALLLVGLLFRLNLDRRASEIGLLLASGYRRGTVRSLLLVEGSCLAAVGALLGLGGAVLYAWSLLELLRAQWPGGTLDQSFLRLHATGGSFLTGYFAALAVSVLTIAWAVRILSRVAPPALLAGQTTGPAANPAPGMQPRIGKKPTWSLWSAGCTVVGALALVLAGKFVQDHELQAMTFFGSGALLLAGGLCGMWAWMRAARHGHVGHRGWLPLFHLGVRNAARHPERSLLTAGLLASASFLIVAVESFHREAGEDYQDPRSGSGGFALIGESDVPIFQDWNSPEGREELLDGLRGARVPESTWGPLRDLAFYPFRLRPGDDASCLNLYQPRKPRLLGVPHALVEHGGFRFAGSLAQSPEEWANPWRLLEQLPEEGTVPIIPVVGEANTVVWQLKSGLGRELEVQNERGEPVRLRFVGLLKDSVFQSEVLMSEANFLQLYPGQQGYNYYLIKVPAESSLAAVESLLETALADRGFEVTTSASRLESYLAVENTYLSTFQLLGGLGLVLGALGLAVVLLRCVWERRAELALLRALGFRHSALGWLMLAENVFLLGLGLVIGTAAALLAVAPHWAGGAGEVPWLRLLGLLALVLTVGLAAGAAAVAATLRTPLLPALRAE